MPETTQAVKDRVHSDGGQTLLKKIADLAKAAATAAQASPSADHVVVGGHQIKCLPGGMCDRFVRQIHETAMGIGDHAWPFAAATAAETEGKLKAHGRQIGGSIPGAVGCWDDATVGHIVIYIGGGMVAENTSSTSRGNPHRAGTKITPLEDVVAAHHGHAGRWYYAGGM